MNTLIQKIKSNTILTIITAFILVLIVLFGSKLLSSYTAPFIEEYFALNFYTKNTIGKFYMLLLSIIIILIVNNGSLKNYGFTRAKNIRYSKMILITIGIVIVSFIVGQILFVGILGHLFPTENTKSFSKPNSIIEMIITVWIWSSICEEIMVRGLMQGFMNHLKTKRFLGLNLSVIISGLFFGFMHLSLLGVGMGQWFVSFIVFNTTVIGLIAAYYREKSGSLLPPVLIHFIANLVGSLPLIIMAILGMEFPA